MNNEKVNRLFFHIGWKDSLIYLFIYLFTYLFIYLLIFRLLLFRNRKEVSSE